MSEALCRHLFWDGRASDGASGGASGGASDGASDGASGGASDAPFLHIVAFALHSPPELIIRA